jgi:hypothetical protein
MPKPHDLKKMLARNPGVDAKRLQKTLEASQRLKGKGGRYRFNLILPFAGRMKRHKAAECSAPCDNVRRPT